MGKYNGMKSIMKGEQNPQGRPRVYFCAHPDDYDKYLKDIAEEIQGVYREAVVWYLGAEDRDFDDEDRENFEADLRHMQLFVIPITSKLLYGDCYAKEEFKLAAENHIPILPLMKEPGLGPDFNAIMGDLQYLDKDAISNDPTALSYEDKFKKYIESVLIGNELAEKIRASFKAYIFLSYRKKDRKYAQEIMHLIHENDFARDIAIWYDEFLTPGENFNDAIADAFKKSSLFALVVTPSLLEMPNYVMTTEYPMAQKAGANILPIEAVETDRNNLSGNYSGIPDAVKTSEPEAVSEALKSLIASALSVENSNDPKHVFFMGLAYLAGIDVEVNALRALDLITYAAEHGVEEAYGKLSAMYESGEGVERNYDTAADWQMKYAEWAEVQMLAGKEDADFVIWRYCDAGDKYVTAGDLSMAEEAYTRMCALAAEYAKTDTPEALRDLSVAYNNLGDTAGAQGDLSKAAEYYEKGLEISLKLSKKVNTAESLRDLSISYSRLGNIARDRGKLDEAVEYFRKYLGISLELTKRPDTPDSLRDLSVAYNKLGDVFRMQGSFYEAGELYEKGLGISFELRKKKDTPESLRDLSISYEKLGNLAGDQGDPEGAEQYFEKSMEIRLELSKKLGTPQSLRDLRISFIKLGDIAKAQGNLTEAAKYYEKGLEINFELSNKLGTPGSLKELSVSFDRLGDIANSQGNPEAAKACYEESLEIRLELSRELCTSESLRDLRIVYNRLGNITLAQGNLTEAWEYYEKGLEISLELSKKQGTPESFTNLALSCYRLGTVAEAKTDYSLAADLYQQACDNEVIAHPSGSHNLDIFRNRLQEVK